MKHGDFTKLADNYAQHRPAYSTVVRDIILGLPEAPVEVMDIADVGAGTGIWTRMMADMKPASIHAVEPNDAMRGEGENDTSVPGIQWHAGSGEETGLADASFDLVTMASSFHWTDFDTAMAEFHRILKPGGWFVALWNPRHIEVNAELVDIENELKRLVPDLKRVSSGKSDFTDTLLNRFLTLDRFETPVYLEGYHTEHMSVERYIGAWRSVNDIQVQCGPERFEQFIGYIENKFAGADGVDAMYRTRAWACRKPV